jgi:hypothetical protein
MLDNKSSLLVKTDDPYYINIICINNRKYFIGDCVNLYVSGCEFYQYMNDQFIPIPYDLTTIENGLYRNCGIHYNDLEQIVCADYTSKLFENCRPNEVKIGDVFYPYMFNVVTGKLYYGSRSLMLDKNNYTYNIYGHLSRAYILGRFAKINNIWYLLSARVKNIVVAPTGQIWIENQQIVSIINLKWLPFNYIICSSLTTWLEKIIIEYLLHIYY